MNHKLSLPAAILININIMLGVGIFINTVELAKRSHGLGFLNYLIIGVLLLPLIICIATLVKMHPVGGFYVYGRREISPFFGFLSAWIYFTGKLASSAIMIHTSVLILQQIILPLSLFNPLMIDIALLSLFIGLNMFNIKTGSNIQAVFMALKASAILFAIFGGLFLFHPTLFSFNNLTWQGIPSSLPLVLYAAMGFEAACSISSQIENPRRNGPLAIFISYSIVICAITLYQLSFFGALGNALAQFESYRDAFPALVNNLLPSSSSISNSLGGLFNIAIATSALGGSYGILFSNSWNLFAVARNHHILGSSWFTKLNRHKIPFLCVMAEGFICALYLIITQGAQVPLQQTSALAAILTYTISVVALMCAQKNHARTHVSRWTPFLGLGSCALLIVACIQGLLTKGATSLYGFTILIALGIVMFAITPGKNLPEANEVLT